MTQTDRQRARKRHADHRSPARLARFERERRAELLIAEVLSLLSQRDVLVAGLEQRAGRCLVEIRSLGWPNARLTALACELTVREATRLRDLARSNEDGASPMSSRLSVSGATVTESEVSHGQHQRNPGQ